MARLINYWWWIKKRRGSGTPDNARVTTDGAVRVTTDGAIRVRIP